MEVTMNETPTVDSGASGGGDHPDGQSSPACDDEGPLVWVCAFESVEGVEISVCADEDIAYRELARVCRLGWDTARRVDSRRPDRIDRPPFPLEPPDDDRLTVASYFAVMREVFQSYAITPHALIGGSGGGAL
jgi:hypothetical protein